MSDDIKGTSLRQLNDGLRTAINRSERKLTSEINDMGRAAVRVAAENTSRQVRDAQRQMQQRIDDAQRSLSGRIADVQRSLGARIDQNARDAAQRMADLDRRHTAAINNLSENVFSAIEAQGQYIDKQIERIDRNTATLAAGLAAVRNNLNDLQADVDRRFGAQQSQINSLRSDVQSLFDARQADTNARLLAAGQALALLETVRQRTDVGRFAPRHMLDAVGMAEARLREAAKHPDTITVSDANSLIDQALVMENEAVRERMKWEAKQKAALTAVDALLRLMQDSMKLEVDSIYDASQKEELQTNYWTHGRYGDLEKEIAAVKARITDPSVSLDELDRLMQRTEELERQSAALREEAVRLGFLSEGRVAVTNDILNAMVAQGWELADDDAGYMGSDSQAEDAREGTFAVLRKAATGESLSIFIVPEQEADGETRNRINFHRNDSRIEAPGAFATRMRQICREIEKSGHKLGQLDEPAAGGTGKLRGADNPAQLRARGGASSLRPGLAAH